ncbi:LysR family transcriptional regulator [Comamonas testosteroni]|uniref:Transcriptional regulator, LysR family n=1 Tax=Comamonas testosteroni (strain DSM 14576 / KF-1) TaxID=399795 RepID=B7X0G0_COMTK|nr:MULTISPECIES: LysR family transcriptional regulator [Comamonas]EED66310.1 transcriptional regulator, LysR family [Comamonas testosteroni KF-1]TYK68285.1 LysR family transcriptional regulator [Comamonas sp. Z3]WQG64563.1 LysR family transcriptional regulator [Comamonas testosteroni]
MDGFSDLAFFAMLSKEGSMRGAAQQLGVTGPAVSKRLAGLEARLGARLMHRTTRRMSLTPEGERYLVEGGRLLTELGALERAIGGVAAVPQGLIRVNASFGFGRKHIAPALGVFARRFPEVEVQLHLSDRPANLIEDNFDVVIRLGDMPDSRWTARVLARNRRVLCASALYLKEAGEPSTPQELARHACLFIREGDEAFGTWHLRNGSQTETVKVRGPLSANDGESASAWAMAGHGILMRSEWEVGALIREGLLKVVLPEWRLPPADVYVQFHGGAHLPAKTKALVDHLVDVFAPQRPLGRADATW